MDGEFLDLFGLWCSVFFGYSIVRRYRPALLRNYVSGHLHLFDRDAYAPPSTNDEVLTVKTVLNITVLLARVTLLLAKAFIIIGIVLWYMVSTQYLGETRYVYIPAFGGDYWAPPSVGDVYYRLFTLPFIWCYVFCVVFLLADGVLKVRAKKYQECVSTFVFTAVGILFLLMTDIQISELIFACIGPIVVIAMNGAMATLSFVALRRFKSRAFVYWTWGYSLSLVREIGVGISTQMNRSPYGGFDSSEWMGYAPWYMHQWQGHYLWNVMPNGFVLELYWLSYIVSGVLIAAGLVLLVRQSWSGGFRPTSTCTAQLVAVGVLVMMMLTPQSLRLFGSPTFITALLLNALMLAYSLAGWWRPGQQYFKLWAWAAGLRLLLTIVMQPPRNWGWPPGQPDRVVLEFMMVALLIEGFLMIVGLALALRQLQPESRVPTSDKGNVMANEVSGGASVI